MHLNKWQSLHFLGNVSTIRKQLIVSLGCIDQVVHHQKQVNGGYLGRVEPLEAPNLERRALRTSAASYITLSLHDHPPTILTACASFCDLDSLRQLLHCWSWYKEVDCQRREKGRLCCCGSLLCPMAGIPRIREPLWTKLGQQEERPKGEEHNRGGGSSLLSSSPSILLETGISRDFAIEYNWSDSDYKQSISNFWSWLLSNFSTVS